MKYPTFNIANDLIDINHIKVYVCKLDTVNIDIFTCIDFPISRGLKFTFLMLLLLCGMIQVVFKLYIFLRIFEKHEYHEYMYSAKMHPFTLVHNSWPSAKGYSTIIL